MSPGPGSSDPPPLRSVNLQSSSSSSSDTAHEQLADSHEQPHHAGQGGAGWVLVAAAHVRGRGRQGPGAASGAPLPGIPPIRCVGAGGARCRAFL